MFVAVMMYAHAMWLLENFKSYIHFKWSFILHEIYLCVWGEIEIHFNIISEGIANSNTIGLIIFYVLFDLYVFA